MDKKQHTAKTSQTKIYEKDLFLLMEKENLTANINFSGPKNKDSKHTINHVLNLHDPLDTIPPSKDEN